MTALFTNVARSSIPRRRLIAWALVLAIWTPAIYALFIEPNRLVVVETELRLPRWPRALDGTKVAILSDLHVGSPFIDLEKVDEIVDRTQRTEPEIVVLLGDFMVGHEPGATLIDPERIAHALSRLHAPLGVYAVLGNHDWWSNGERVSRALVAAGIHVLENEVIEVHRGNESFSLVGLADLMTRNQAIDKTLAKVQGSGPIIVITHEPDLFPSIPERVALTLAGHTHGGQVALPLLGRPIVPSEYGERYARGHVVEGGRNLFVTSGIGTSIFPVRFGVPPEIVILTLRSSAPP